ncbi:response regulator transcription factor [Paraglaciecola marina]|uniref:response regulator transcription factor n=1 Tax=Paraglaciecola marina TaxID=2500157 RepID=UPI00105B3EA6|nr:response regulator transcription factor [Paraglaciecola marina]
MTTFLIADDHPLYREALVGALSPLFADLEIKQADSLESTITTLKKNKNFDLVLLDLNMPGCDSFLGLIRVLEDFPGLPVAVVSASDSSQVISKVMSLGAKGFISKTTPTETIAEALKQIMKGNIWLPEGYEEFSSENLSTINVANLVAGLTPKQFKVVKLLQDGLLNKQIAADLEITEATVKAHISAIFKKLGVKTRTQAVLLLKELDIE